MEQAAKRRKLVKDSVADELQKTDGTKAEEVDEEEGEEEEALEDDEEEDLEGDESEESLSLAVDQDGRICSTTGLLTTSMNFDQPARVFDDFVASEHIAGLRECCEECFKVKPSKGRYSSGKTFWADWDQVARCELEALALAILRKHCPKPAGAAGVEWWTLCLDSDANVGWHWDRDYVLEDSGVNIHPMLSTVTYLSLLTGQLSTVVLDILSPPSRDSKNPVCLSAAGDSVSSFTVYPRAGRHLVFDGRLLHGAPAQEACQATNPGSQSTAKRVTFLANIWVGHRPANASPLPTELQGFSNTGSLKDVTDKTGTVLAETPTQVQPMSSAAAGGKPRAFPLEGGQLRTLLPAAPEEHGYPPVVMSTVNCSWTPTRRAIRKK